MPDRGGVNSPRRSNLLNNQCLNKRPILLDSPTEGTYITQAFSLAIFSPWPTYEYAEKLSFLPAAKRQGQVELNVEKKIGTYGF